VYSVIDAVIFLIRCGLFDVLFVQALWNSCRKHTMKVVKSVV